MEISFQAKINKYFKNISDLEFLPEIINGVLINDDFDFKEGLQQLVLSEGLEFVVGVITKGLVINSISTTQKLIEQNSEDASLNIDLLFDSLSPVFTKIKFDYLSVCKDFYGLSEEQASLFVDSIFNKHSKKEEFLNLFFNNLKKHRVFQDLKDDITQSILDNLMFAEKGKENSKAYNLAFKAKKYKEQFNQFDMFFEYLQETYQPKEIYELMSKFSIYVKTKNFHYDLLSENIFDDEPNMESLIDLREKFSAFKKGEGKSEFFKTLISRLKLIQLPAKLTSNNAVDIYSAKITFNHELPYRYKHGCGMITPGPFVDYAIKNRCFVEDNKTSKNFAFGRIMASEPMNDIFNHQYAYRKENIAYNKLVESGHDIIVYEFQKPALVSKLIKKTITIEDPNDIDKIADIFDNIINLARNKVEKPKFDSLTVQIGKNYYDVNILEDVYAMTNKLISYINDGSISLESQSVINLIEKTFLWVNTCVDLETNESNLNLIYSEGFRDGVFSLAQKLNAPLQNNLIDLYSKLNVENKTNNILKAHIHIEKNEIKKIQSNWKDIKYFDKLVVKDDVKEKLDSLNFKVEEIAKVSAKYFSTIESKIRANGSKVSNMKRKFDDILQGKNQTICQNGRLYYHSVTTMFEPKYDRVFEKYVESIFIQRNRLRINKNDFLDVGTSLNNLNKILENPNEFLLEYASYNNKSSCEQTIKILEPQNKILINLIKESLECFSFINKEINETSQIDIFEGEKLSILEMCANDMNELDDLLKGVINKKIEKVSDIVENIKFKHKRINI